MKRDRGYGTGHDHVSRRDAFKAAAAVAVAPFLLRETLAAQRPPVAEDAGTLDRARSATSPRATCSSTAARSPPWVPR